LPESDGAAEEREAAVARDNRVDPAADRFHGAEVIISRNEGGWLS
jgi:hypothetical protein